MMYRDSYRQTLFALTVGLWASVAAVSCAPEFNDEQCVTDQDCFPDEVCSVQGVCELRGSGDTGIDAESDAGAAEIASIEVAPQQVDVAVGLTVPLDATAFDIDGNEIENAAFEWTSSDELVATVNADGEVTGLELGTATITVRSAADSLIETSASITVVEGEVDTVDINPESLELTVGEVAELTATALNEGGAEIGDVQVVWSSDDESIASVDTAGTVLATGLGETTVTATVEGVQGSVVVTVQPVPVERIEIAPVDPSVEVGGTIDLTATAFDAEDNELTGRQITWSSDDEAIATIDSGGVVTGIGLGTAMISAQVGSVTASVEVEVVPANTAPIAEAGADQVVLLGEVVVLDATGSDDVDGDTLSYSWAFDSQPNGSTATLSNTTAAQPNFTGDIAGDFVLELTVDDGEATSTDTVTITVNTPPVADAGAAQTVVEGDTINLDGSSSSDADGDTLSYSWTIASTPSGSSATLMDASTATPSFTADAVGTFVVELTVDDGRGGTAGDTVTLTVEAANTPPVADAGADQTVFVGDAVNLDGAASSDADNDTLSYSWTLTSQPTNSTATLNNAASATPSFTADEIGSYVIELTVDDGTVTATDTVTITAQAAPNSPPVANDDTVTTDEDTAVTADVVGNDTDADNDGLTVTITTAPTRGAASVVNNQIEYTPNANFNGTDTLTYEVADGNGGFDTATLTINVTAVNDDPVAVADTATLDEDTTVTVDVLPNDSDVDTGQTLTVVSTTMPSNGTATVVANQIEYTPNADFNGTDTLTYEVSDGNGGFDTATVTFNVTAVNDDPVAADDTATLDEDTTATVDVLANDSDVDTGQTLAITSTTMPANGTATVVGNSQISYTPNANFNGTDSLTYQIDDGNGGTATATVILTVNAVNDAPTADAGVNQTVTTGSPVSLDGSNSGDIDGDSITYSWTFTRVPTGSGATLTDGTTATPTFTPDLDGDYVLELTVDDGSTTATDTVTVTAAP